MDAATPRTIVSVVTTKLVALAVEARASTSAAPNKRVRNMVDLLVEAGSLCQTHAQLVELLIDTKLGALSVSRDQRP
ncbi:hypothetical protein D9M73_222240 [compost metagenome]